jgi:hypothetical protein
MPVFVVVTDFQQTMWTLLLLGPYVIYTWLMSHRHGDTETSVKLRASAPLWLVVIMLAAFIIPALFAPLPQLLEANQPTIRQRGWKIQPFAFQVQNLLRAPTMAILRSACCCRCWRLAVFRLSVVIASAGSG